MPTLLFDIDGTLIRTGGAGKAAMEAALADAFGIHEIQDVVPYSGRTDPAIGHDLLRVHGIERTPANFQRLQESYLSHLGPCLKAIPGTVLPGIVQLLDQLRAGRRRLGLLTGNGHVGARTKLSHFGLWDYFEFGAFGDEHHDRNDLARSARILIESRHGEDATREIWVIGDTPLDVACAQAIGARSIAVATGWHTYEELNKTGADLVLNDLSQWHDLPPHWFH